ncbi:MAG TPA: ferritin-like domain-containing protein [Candidatus Sumerlaeota bacterium]|nr:MAG: hypothetical protein BWZ08_02086 [candidate division BRC1 bacterium ADurb.BinA292]HOE95736.1 ferritin-like domain-containing protein [Candidatus Sumerlaeota bacterium]HOR26824.1 ferritin-like domain-containing protein [Candidatus Sumerlaeota bacterium]HPK01572.1 ferritin-like domain-containing protein [Candidatus Sumerlaeota bacterium]
MSIESLRDLFVDEMKDIYHAEKQLVKALPKMARAAATDELRAALEAHLDETKGQVERLEEAFALLELPRRGKKCEAMEGLVSEGEELIEEEAEPIVKDAGLIASAQKVEHYEMASYGTLVSFAKLLKENKVATLLEQTLAEEKNADRKLTAIAEKYINVEALGGA